VKHIDEHSIEKYIRFPDTLSIAVRQEIERQIARSVFAAGVAAFLSEFYDEWDSVEDILCPQVDVLMFMLFPTPDEERSREAEQRGPAPA
jgi:uncharacterized membrane protein YjdF